MRINRIIAALAGLSQRVLHLFGVFPVVTGIRMLVMAEKAPDLEKNPVLRLAHRHLRISKDYH
ncbi:MAG: hypothetical protein Q8S10_14070, partial [Thiobacillus sp.]|nr:hypothetical protein [Thiobacillus sp.]